MSIDIEKAKREGALAKQRHRHQEELDTIRDAHVQEIRKMRSATSLKSVKRRRTNDRTEVYAEACRKASAPGNPRSVLAALKVLASSRAYSQLCGYDPDARAFKWDTGRDEPPKFQSEKDALAAIKLHMEKSR